MGFTIKNPSNVAGSATSAILAGLFISFGGVLFGYDTGTIGAGTFFGALLSAPIADYIGRRWTMIVNTAVLTLGCVFQTIAVSIPLFVAGRFFAAPKWIRGTVVGCYRWATTIGLLIAAIVLNATKDRNDTGSYHIPVAVQFVFSIIMWIGMAILPETLRFLIRKGDSTAAARSLSKLRRLSVGHPELIEELAEIQANHEYEMRIGTSSYLACFKAPIFKRQLTGMALQALQQLTGVNFIFYYGTSYFAQPGISNPFLITMITSICNVVSTLPGLYLVELWDRRSLLIFGAIGMSVCQIIVASVGTALPNSGAASKWFIAFVYVYISFFASTWGPCAWVATGEIFPLKARAKGLSMTIASNLLLDFAISFSEERGGEEASNYPWRGSFLCVKIW